MSQTAAPSLPATRRALLPGLFRRGRARPREAQGIKASGFKGQALPLLLLAPQLLILLLFFFIPAIRGLAQAFLLQDPFGQEVHFVGLENITALLRSAEYRESLRLSAVFAVATTALTFSVGLVLAFATDRVTRGRTAYRAVLLLPYAIAPAVAGFVWAFLFNPLVGPAAGLLHALGIAWDPNRDSGDAMLLVILTASWKHLCYDYIFLVAALAAIPRSVIEAAAVDGAGPLRRFANITFPMIAPTVFFLLVMNTVYGLFETFAIIDATTRGGPAAATSILVYKVYVDGFVNLDLGSSAAQSVLLMILAVSLTVVQFRLIERRISYDVSQ
ncbi:ABC transporter permease subunit [Pararoseomonas indoligenes]|uniref:sn-glycerol-3-phosphate transport system permease protein UgpA n=1 Tax=Roseomonas indoligenes TaxID=2820811 RepID=A0A940S6C5_9PROT|nr:ABC transporter permease subunit [Pararoseomonas indoligenes]MBP0493889.1 ABC transporter permease subunit [Pararoseomonas indoligenes]